MLSEIPRLLPPDHPRQRTLENIQSPRSTAGSAGAGCTPGGENRQGGPLCRTVPSAVQHPHRSWIAPKQAHAAVQGTAGCDRSALLVCRMIIVPLEQTAQQIRLSGRIQISEASNAPSRSRARCSPRGSRASHKPLAGSNASHIHLPPRPYYSVLLRITAEYYFRMKNLTDQESIFSSESEAR